MRFAAFSVSKEFTKLFPTIERRVGGIEVFGIQMILDDTQTFTETLEMNDFTFPQITNGIADLRIFYKAKNIFIGAPCFLFRSHV